MAPNDASQQVQFLVTCIKHCTAPGKVDFAAVAAELGVASKAAAAKRYERLLKAHNAWPSSAGNSGPGAGEDGAPSAPATPMATPKGKGKAKAAASAPSRGRKRKGATNDVDDDNDEKPEAKVARKIKDEIEVKQDPIDHDANGSGNE